MGILRGSRGAGDKGTQGMDGWDAGREFSLYFLYLPYYGHFGSSLSTGDSHKREADMKGNDSLRKSLSSHF